MAKPENEKGARAEGERVRKKGSTGEKGNSAAEWTKSIVIAVGLFLIEAKATL